METAGKDLVEQAGELKEVEIAEPLPAEPLSVMALIDRAARDPAVNVEKMDQLLRMHERILDRQASQDFAQAMNRAQAKVKPIITDLENRETRSRYASYAALDKALRPIYIAEGFSLTFNTEDAPTPESVRVACVVSHTGGAKLTYRIDMPADGKGPKGGAVMSRTHATGSGVSYGMRYLLKMIFNLPIVDADDDGNQAGSGKKFISEKQAADLEAMASEVGADRHKFLKFMKVGSFREIEEKDLQKASAALGEKRKRQGGSEMKPQIIECEQGSEAWQKCRLGIPTASEFAAVLADGKGRQTYLLKLVGERITGVPADGFRNEHTDRGHEMEQEARDLYEVITRRRCKQVGFIKSGLFGCSPDSLIASDGMLEIKTKLPHILGACILDGRMPKEHLAQIQGQLWIAQRKWVDFVAYWPGMPLFLKRVKRDEKQIKAIARALHLFAAELDQVEKKIRRAA